MARHDMNIAFEFLLEELEGVVNELNEEGARAFRSGNYDKAGDLIQQVSRLTDFREKIRNLQREWGTVFAPTTPLSAKQQSKLRPQLARALRTPRHAFRAPILQAIAELGGSARTREVLDLVGAKMQGVLNRYDHEPMPSDPGKVRWRDTAQWCRFAMVKKGLLRSGSPRGVWEITPEGRRELQRLSKQGP